jgi:hypothetical protein
VALGPVILSRLLNFRLDPLPLLELRRVLHEPERSGVQADELPGLLHRCDTRGLDVLGTWRRVGLAKDQQAGVARWHWINSIRGALLRRAGAHRFDALAIENTAADAIAAAAVNGQMSFLG